MIRTASITLALTASLARRQVSTYCTAGTTVQGCVPSISGVGVPSAIATSGFDIVVDDVPTQRMGLIFYRLNAIPQPQPWAVGSPSYLCIYYPVNRTGAHNSGGALGVCDGELRVDFNAWRAANSAALGSPFAMGQVLYAQGWFRDPGAAKQTNLSNGLRFVLTPALPPTVSGMVQIPAGTFSMGSDAPSGPPYFGEYGASSPAHLVSLSYPFWIGATEVTQEQYTALMATNPSFWQAPDKPVDRVSWLDAQAYCTALNAQQQALGAVSPGYEFRLPTEAEWEYACRAGTQSEFNVGVDLDPQQANILSSSGTTPVGFYAPNAWGLYDMHGNVWEWCLDSFSTYSAATTVNPFNNGGTDRVFRGGGFSHQPYNCRSAFRGYGPTNFANYDVGFRVVLAPILVP